MAIKIKLKNSVTQDAVPTGTHLPEVGELAVNANINSIGGYMRASDNSIVKIFGPGSVSTPAASTTVSGIAELATSAETTTGTDTARVCTPAGVKAVTDAERTTSNSTYLALAGGTLVGVLQATAGSNSAPAIHFGDTDSGIYGGTNTVSLAAGGTQGLTLNSSAEVNIPTKLGIGIANPTHLIHVSNATTPRIVVEDTTNNVQAQLGADNSVARIGTSSNHAVSFRINDTEKAQLDTSGRLLIGHSSSIGQHAVIQSHTTSTDTFAGFKYGANSSPNIIRLGKSRNASIGGNTILQENDEIGRLIFSGASGPDYNDSAFISCFVDEAPGAGSDMPGRLSFWTSDNGSAVPEERFTIKKDGLCGIGTVNPGTKLEIADSTASSDLVLLTLNASAGAGNSNCSLRFEGNSGTSSVTEIKHKTTGNLVLRTYGGGQLNDVLTVDSNQRVGIGVTNPGELLSLKHATSDTVLDLECIAANDGTTGNIIKFRGKGANGVSYHASQIKGITENAANNAGLLSFWTNNAGTVGEKMRLDSAGRLGLGTINPAKEIHIGAIGGDDVNSIRIDGTNNNSGGEVHRFVIENQGSSALVNFKTSAANSNETTKLTINSITGKIGIGTTSPTTKLHIYDSTEDTPFYLDSGNANGAHMRFLQGSTVKHYLGCGGGISLGDKDDFAIRATDNLFLASGNTSTARLTIDAAGEIGIGTTSPTGIHNLAKVLEISGGDGGDLIIGNNASPYIGAGAHIGAIAFKNIDTAGSPPHYAGIRCEATDTSGNMDLRFYTGTGNLEANTPQFVVKVGGNIDHYGNQYHLYNNANTSNTYFVAQNTGAGNAGIKMKNTDGEWTIIANDRLRFIDDDSNSERLTIKNDGKVGIGNTDPSSNLHIKNTAGAAILNLEATADGGEALFKAIGKSSGGDSRTVQFRYDSGADAARVITAETIPIEFMTQNTGRIKIDTEGTGDIYLGGASTAGAVNSGNTKGFVYDNDGGSNHPFICIQHATKTSGAAPYIQFQSQAGTRGSIVESSLGTQVTYNTTSDYRLKQDEVLISDGISKVKQLKPYYYKWKESVEFGYSQGFFAHEVGDIVKEAISGTKDEVVTQAGIDDKTYKGAAKVGDPVYQSIDYGRLTPLLTAALKEAITKIETLEAKVAALEAA